MKLRSFIKKLIPCIAFAGFLNYFSLPIAFHFHSTSLKKHVKDKKIQKVCKTDSYLESIVTTDALSILRFAHAISAKHLSFEHCIFPSYKEKQRALEGKADCSYFSGFTYSNFLYLADKLGKPELKNKVRLCSGEANGAAHAWLQIYLNNKWRNYETASLLEKKDEINLKNLNTEIPYWKVLDYTDYYPFSYIQFENNKLVNHTKFFGSFEKMDLKDLIIKYCS